MLYQFIPSIFTSCEHSLTCNQVKDTISMNNNLLYFYLRYIFILSVYECIRINHYNNYLQYSTYELIAYYLHGTFFA